MPLNHEMLETRERVGLIGRASSSWIVGVDVDTPCRGVSPHAAEGRAVGALTTDRDNESYSVSSLFACHQYSCHRFFCQAFFCPSVIFCLWP